MVFVISALKCLFCLKLGTTMSKRGKLYKTTADVLDALFAISDSDADDPEDKSNVVVMMSQIATKCSLTLKIQTIQTTNMMMTFFIN